MNGPEGFLPKKQDFTMQVVQVLWYCPIFQCPSAFRDGEKLKLQIFVHLYLVTSDTEAELLVIYISASVGCNMEWEHSVDIIDISRAQLGMLGHHYLGSGDIWGQAAHSI